MKPEKKSPDLEQLKQLLAKSYDGSEAEDVPPMPDALRDRITDQYGHSATKPSPQAESQKVSFFSALTQLFATPSLRAVSALVIMLLVATVVIKTSTTSTKGPGRGGDENPSSITCILYGLDADEQTAVSASGLDEEALQTITSATALDSALKGDGLRIVINGETDLILGYLPGADKPTIEEPLPSDPAALSAKLAEILNELQN